MRRSTVFDSNEIRSQAPPSFGSLAGDHATPVPSAPLRRGVDSGDFVRFLLLLAGASGVVAGLWNVPRFRETRELENRLESAQQQVNAIFRERQRFVRIADAFQNDPHYREGMIRLMSGERLPGEVTVGEWLEDTRRGTRAEP